MLMILQIICCCSNYFQVPKGVNSFDYSKDWNILVSGGVDTTMRLWNPFDYSKPVAVREIDKIEHYCIMCIIYQVMKGHKTAIIYVEVNDENKQIVSFSRDLVSHMIPLPLHHHTLHHHNTL